MYELLIVIILVERIDLKLFSEIKSLIDELDHAYNRFDFADPEYIDAAIYDLNASTLRLNSLLRKIKCNESSSNIKMSGGDMDVRCF